MRKEPVALTVTSRRRSFVLRADARAESQTLGNGSTEVNGRFVAMNSATANCQDQIIMGARARHRWMGVIMMMLAARKT